MWTKSFALAWVAVCFCRVVLITNGAIYAKAGIAYFSDTYDGFALREAGNATLAMPVLRPVIKDQVIADQLDGLLILAPFMGAAYTCVGFTSLAAACFFRNLEAAITLLLQAALFSMLGCIVRPHEPDEFYNAGEKDNVQNSQMVAVITGWIGATGPLVAALLKEHVPTPGEQLLALHSHFKGDGAPPLTPGIQLKDGIEA